MNIWVIKDGEPIPGIDKGAREWRSGMLCKALAAAGHNVVWWASTFEHSTKTFRYSEAQVVELGERIRVRLLHGPGYAHNKSPKRFIHHRLLAMAFAKEAMTCLAPELIFCSLPTLELAEKAVTFGNSMNVPVIVDVRDAWPDHYLTLVPSALRGLARFLLYTEIRRAHRIFKGAAGIVAISERYLSFALCYARRKKHDGDGIFHIAYPSITSEAERLVTMKEKEFLSHWPIKKNQLMFTFVGSFTASFALTTVVQAARQLANAGRDDVRFVIVGDGEQDAKLRSLAEGMNNVIFTSWLDQASVQAILRISTVGLAPYKNDTMITLPNKPFEYMSAGLPLLSSLKGELEDLIKREKIGLQYQAGDPQSLARQVIWLAEHPEERREMGRRVSKLFEERYNADLIYPKLVKHIEYVAEEYGRSER
jgi:glycosyltransferase involved in cell wall biosynthesis